MDKLRLSTTSQRDDFARLYNWNDGFSARTDGITLPAGDTLTLFLICVRDYEVRAEGDITVERDAIYGDEFMRFYSARWKEPESPSDKARTGRVLLVNPSTPETPYVFELSEGPQFAYAPSPDAAPTGDAHAGGPLSDGARQMLMHEATHRMLGNLLG